MGVLLKANPTGHGHAILFGRWAWMPVPVSTTYQKIGDLFCPVKFLDSEVQYSVSRFFETSIMMIIEAL